MTHFRTASDKLKELYHMRENQKDLKDIRLQRYEMDIAKLVVVKKDLEEVIRRKDEEIKRLAQLLSEKNKPKP